MLKIGLLFFVIGLYFIEASFNHWNEYESKTYAGIVGAIGLASLFSSFIFFALTP